MKYTGYLINGKHLHCDEYTPNNIIAQKIWLMVTLTFSVFISFFCLSLLPITFVVDVGRMAYCLEIKTVRKLKRVQIRVYIPAYKISRFVSRAASIMI